MALLEGVSPDDEILVDIAVWGIKKASEASGNGWILLNFPQTKTQAQILEKKLSGYFNISNIRYEEPKPVKPGNLKRIATAVTALVPNSRQRSLVAQSEIKSNENIRISSGLDMVIMLHVNNEIAVKREAGQRIDAVTNRKYHLEFSPPPLDTPGLNERLSTKLDDGNSAEQLQYRIQAFEDQEELLESWFSRFGNIEKLPNENSVEEMTSNAFEVITDLVLRKQLETGPDKIDEKIEDSEIPDEPTTATPDEPLKEETSELEKSKVDSPKSAKRMQSGSEKLKPGIYRHIFNSSNRHYKNVRVRCYRGDDGWATFA